MFSFKSIMASYSLSAKLEPEKWEKLIQSLKIKRSTILDYVYPNNVKIATVHMRLEEYKELGAFIQECCRLIEQAIACGAHLVLFPHLLGLVPIMVDKTSGKLAADFIHSLKSVGDRERQHMKVRFDHLIDRFSDFLFDSYYNIFLLLAHKYNIYIAAGSTYLATVQGVYCRSYLFSPDHDEAFFQDKVTLTPLEKQLGIRAGEELVAIDLKIGKVCLLTDSDSLFYECYKVAKGLGAQIVLSPTLFPKLFSHSLEYHSSRMNAQHYNLFTVCSAFYCTGGVFPAFEGATGIYAPISLTKDLDGVVAHTQNGSAVNAIVSSRIDPPKLAENMDVYSYFRNAAFCEKLCYETYPNYFGINSRSRDLPKEMDLQSAPIKHPSLEETMDDTAT